MSSSILCIVVVTDVVADLVVEVIGSRVELAHLVPERADT